MAHNARLGSVSTGTLRLEDLLGAFSDELRQLDVDSRYADLVAKAESVDAESEAAQELLGELEEALNDYAPPYCYFGAHPGDGADIGYWPDWDAIESDRRDGTLPSGDSLPARGSAGGHYLHISDHGNAELYSWDPSAKGWKSEWGMV